MIKHGVEFQREVVRIALTSGLPRKRVAADLGAVWQRVQPAMLLQDVNRTRAFALVRIEFDSVFWQKQPSCRRQGSVLVWSAPGNIADACQPTPSPSRKREGSETCRAPGARHSRSGAGRKSLRFPPPFSRSSPACCFPALCFYFAAISESSNDAI